jgi:hypothetical protein
VKDSYLAAKSKIVPNPVNALNIEFVPGKLSVNVEEPLSRGHDTVESGAISETKTG